MDQHLLSVLCSALGGPSTRLTRAIPSVLSCLTGGIPCGPFTKAGFQLFDQDPRALQAYGAPNAAIALGVDIALHECTPELLVDDATHGMFTHMSADYLRGGMVVLEAAVYCDSHLGGPSDRRRLVIHAERAEFAAVLPRLRPLVDPDNLPASGQVQDCFAPVTAELRAALLTGGTIAWSHVNATNPLTHPPHQPRIAGHISWGGGWCRAAHQV